MRRTMTLAGLAGLAMTVLAAGGCANQDTLAEAAFRGGEARYDESGQLYRIYDYYPDAQVYFSPFTQRYFWRNRDGESFGSSWQNGTTLPTTISLARSSSVVVELPTPRPQEMHAEVEAAYPDLATLQARVDELSGAPAGAYASVPTE